MVRPKNQAKKQGKSKKSGIDFKKIKRKIGRKLPPPSNATNTQVKVKAIILPEQSLAADKADLAVSKKGLTLKELLQQTSHHNAKVRKDALVGVKDLFLKYPRELRLHKSAAIEKLRERICDDETAVRETVYQLFKLTIFPACKEDNQASLLSLTTAYIFNAMTHLTIDVRLMAFKFFDLVVQYYPPSFSLNAEKILQNYVDILQKNHFYLEDKGKLMDTLAGLLRCLSLLPHEMTEADLAQKGIAPEGVLHAYEPDEPKEHAGLGGTLKKMKELIPVLVNCFREFLPLVQKMPVLDDKSFDCMLSILKSIDLAVKFILYWTEKFKSELQISVPHLKETDVFMQDQKNLPGLLLKLFNAFPLSKINSVSGKDDDKYFILNNVITETYLRLREWICSSAQLFDKFLEFIEKALSGEVGGTRSHKAFYEKHTSSLLPFIPKLLSQVDGNLKSRILQAFTKAFKDCRPESSMKLACLSTVEEMLIPKHAKSYLDASDPAILTHQITWIRELPSMLVMLRDKHPLASQIVLHLQVFLGKHALLNSSLAREYDDMQDSMIEFYCTRDDGNVCYGPFIRLPRESQELAICCLYYFNSVRPPLLEALASCCLCHDLEPSVLFRIIEVLHCAYKVGHVKMVDHISFLITLVARFRVFPDSIFAVVEGESKISNRGTFRSASSVISSCLGQMGDNSVVFQMLEKLITDQISQKPHLDNLCALFRVLIGLDSRPSRLSEESISSLSNILAGYLIDIMRCMPEEEDDETTITFRVQERRYYYIPCFFLFEKRPALLENTLNVMGSYITGNSISPSNNFTQHASAPSRRITAVVSTVILMYKDAKVQRILNSYQPRVDHVLESISLLQASEETNLTIEERHTVQCAIDRLKIVRSAIHDGMRVT